MQTFLIVATIVLSAWSAISGLIGVRVGQRMSQDWAHQHWLADKKAAEYGEVLAALTKAYLFTIRPQVSVEAQKARDDAETASHETIAGQVFVGAELEKRNIGDRWVLALRTLDRNHDRGAFGNSYQEIAAEIHSAAREILK